ncbi:MAG: copper resistance protein NlpE [Cytophagaceae bacterium]|nr:copper resistance protein NlpE [Cytophagaceae bacterium]
MKHIFLLLLTGFTLFSCEKSNNSNEIPKKIAAQRTDTIQKDTLVNDSIFTRIYTGVLPCADCPGIETTLKISRDYQQFELKEVYLEREAEPIVTRGNLNTERGFGKDKNATVFILNWDKPIEQQRMFVRYTGFDHQVTMISNEREVLDRGMNWVLKEK